MEAKIDRQKIVTRILEISSTVAELQKEHKIRVMFLSACSRHFRKTGGFSARSYLPKWLYELENFISEARLDCLDNNFWSTLKTSSAKIKYILKTLGDEMSVKDLTELIARMDGSSQIDILNKVNSNITAYEKRGIVERIVYGRQNVTYRIINKFKVN
ncbi:hypothetical protein ACS5PU_16360 [Pedobacter sp. GSP4]|uniref:hypothetical protein n=1 Tax=Pedobacter sp. GSP4 TaxID=3453716 RepID=UPI003EEAA354